jgi:hypothetical protein
VHAVDPDRDGEILWQARVGKGGKLGGVQWGSAVDRENVYVAVSDLGWKKVERAGRASALGAAMEPDPAAGQWHVRTPAYDGRDHLANIASRMRRQGGVQPGAIGGGDRNTRRGLSGAGRTGKIFSGYGAWGGIPGNVLLAFSLKHKMQYPIRS